MLLLVSLAPPPGASPPPSSHPALSGEHGFHGTWIYNQFVQMTVEQVHVYWCGLVIEG